jgi:hypothetical protein
MPDWEDEIMRSRRNDPLRYIFKDSTLCILEINKINGKLNTSRAGEALLLDLSQNGCKIESDLDFRAKYNTINIVISFNLLDHMRLEGVIKWQERKWLSYFYGIRFTNHSPQSITEQLKLYTKELRKTNEERG